MACIGACGMANPTSGIFGAVGDNFAAAANL
jgi:hypothetical protein